jgi:hypothetical protein
MSFIVNLFGRVKQYNEDRRNRVEICDKPIPPSLITKIHNKHGVYGGQTVKQNGRYYVIVNDPVTHEVAWYEFK